MTSTIDIQKIARTGIPGFDPWATAGTGDWFDKNEAEAWVEFPETCCKHVKGELAGQHVRLELWQQSIFANAGGWKRADGTRRFREVFVFIPRGNGKTTIAACLVNLFLFLDDEPGAELYSAAAEREQAKLCFDIVAGMIRQEPALDAEAEIFQKAVTVGDKSYKAISAEAGSKHGYNSHFIVIDELHAHRTPNLVEVLMTGTGKRRQPLVVHLTTADFERESICNSKHDYAKKVRDGIISDPAFLPVIFEADPEDDWTDPAVWRKANPNFGVSVPREYLERECNRAQADPSYLNTFKRLHLNMKTSTNTAVIDMQRWDACDPRRREDELRGRTCYGAIDVASKSDINAFVLLFPNDNAVDLLCWFWVPEGAVEKRKRDSGNRGFYHGWANDGYLELIQGDRMDQDIIRSTINTQGQRFRIDKIAFDPWNCEKLRQELEADGFEMVEFGQSLRNFTEPFKEWLSKIATGKLRHGNNPVLRWMASNLSAWEDQSGNLRPDKKKSPDKIDGQVAGIMALALSMFERTEESIYNERGPIEID